MDIIILVPMHEEKDIEIVQYEMLEEPFLTCFVAGNSDAKR